MRRIVGILLVLSACLVDGFSFGQDQGDIKTCVAMVDDVFNGVLTEYHVAVNYYWGKPCDPEDPEFYWLLCDSFEERYREHLNPGLRELMSKGELRTYTKKTISGAGRFILLHWSWAGPDGVADGVYFEFIIDGEVTGNRMRLYDVMRTPSDFWKEELKNTNKNK